MRYRQLFDDQRIRFVEHSSERVFSSCVRLQAGELARLGVFTLSTRPKEHVVAVMTRREVIAAEGRRAAAARERMMELAA